MKQNLHNTTFWITGASSGIGKALTLHLSEAGAKVIISSRRESALQEVQKECAHPENIFILPLDLEDYSAASSWAERAIQAFGQVDVLIANGGMGQFGSVLDNDWSVEKKIIDINLLGTMAITKAILPHMVERQSGRIVGIASIAGKFGQRNLAAYSASKAGVILWLESLREELFDKGVVVQAVSPGFIKTDVTINSLRPDGSPINKDSKAQENGMPTAIFAKKLMNVINGTKFHNYIGNRELLAVPLHHYARGIFYKLLRRSYR